MADSAEALELQLQDFLKDQREALDGLTGALSEGPNAELQQIKEEVEASVAETEQALLGLKKSRLLAEVEAQARLPSAANATLSEVDDFAAQPGTSGRTADGVHIGGCYRFRFSDGLWHDGIVTAVGNGEATVRFSTPMQSNMLGGVLLPSSALKLSHDVILDVTSLPPGSGILVKEGELWHRATIISVEAAWRSVTVSLAADASRRAVPFANIALPPAASLNAEDDSADDTSSSDEDVDAASGSGEQAEDQALAVDRQGSGEAEQGPPGVVGWAAAAMANAAEAVLRAVEAGPQSDAAHFATWEGATRGIGSKLLAGMGYVKGKGLGRELAGMAAPLQVQLLRPKGGLGLDPGPTADGKQKKKKKKRGGERSRRRQQAEAARAAREAARGTEQADELRSGDPGVFSFINRSLGAASEVSALKRSADASHLASSNGVFANLSANGVVATKKQQPVGDRKALMSQGDQLVALRQQVERLTQMAARNARDKKLSGQIRLKLQQAVQELRAAEARHASAQHALHAHESNKKWMKF